MTVELILARRAACDYRGARRVALQAVDCLDGPERVDALIELGRLHHEFAAFDEAEAALLRAAGCADTEQRARALAILAGVRRDQGQPVQAGPIVAEALALHRSCDVLLAAGGLEVDIGRYGQAQQFFEEAVPAAGGDDGLRRLALEGLATARRFQGRYGDADALLGQALSLAETAFGQDALEVASILNSRGINAKFWGRFAAAWPCYERALALLERAVGPEHPDVASLEHNLGGLAHAQGDHDRAQAHARRSVEVRERTTPPGHPALAADRAALAAILASQRRDDEAEALLRAAIADLEAVFGEDNHDLAAALHNLAGVLARRGVTADAETCYRRALAIKERIEPGSAGVALTLNNLALLRKRHGDRHEARALLERAVALLEGSVDDTHPALASARRNHAALISVEPAP